MTDALVETTPIESEGEGGGSAPKPKRTRSKRPFPTSPLEEVVLFGSQIMEFGAGHPVRRITLFDHLGKSPDSSASRTLITNASKFGLIRGNYNAEQLELTVDGRIAVESQVLPRQRREAQIRLFNSIEVFRHLHERFAGNKLPAKGALLDAIKEAGVEASLTEEGVELFIVNLRYLGLLQTLAGAERIIEVNHALEAFGSSSSNKTGSQPAPTNATDPARANASTPQSPPDTNTFDNVAFFIAPIGELGSEQRMHSDLFLSSFVEPALEQFGIRVVRADAIESPGVITKQVLEYLIKSRLVIADLSFHNPNVFYELAIRHMMRKPVVQIIRNSDRIPFDVNQVRTIQIDDSSIYKLVPKIDSYKAEISNQVRRALEDPDAVDSPISLYFPHLKSFLQ
jgi:hypothetical protein